MAATSGVDQLRIVVVSEEDDRERLYKFTPTTSVAEVVAAWIEDEGTKDEWLVRTDSGTSLTGAEQLIDISEGKKVVSLYVEKKPVEEPAEETVTLSLSLFGESGDVHQLTVSLSQTVEEIHPAVRESFDVSSGRTFRLMRGDGPVKYALPLAKVGLPLTCSIVVELGYVVDVEDSWSGCTERHFVFASECLTEILETNPRCTKRLYLGESQVDSCRSLFSILPAHMRQMMSVSLRHIYQKCVTLLVDRKWKSYVVWQQDKLAKVLPVQSDGQVWKYDGQIVNSGQTFEEISLQDGGLLLQDRPVMLRYSSGEAAVLWMPQLSTVAHLREEVLKKEVDADFSLKFGKRVLQLEEYLPQMSDSDKAITVVRSENSFEVDLDGKEVKWISRTGNIRFSQFCRELLQNGKLKWSDLADLEFRCDGCGRQIRRCEEEFQLLPADCCHVRSLRLSSYNPVEVKDRAAQGQSRSDHMRAMRNKTFGYRTDVQGGSSQTRVEGMDAATETCGGMGGRAVCTQHPPPSPPSPRPFQLRNVTRKGRFQGQVTDVSLLLPSSPTAGQLTTAMALECGLRPEETEIGTFVSVSRGVRIVVAVEGEEEFYTTEDGSRRVEWEDVKDWKIECWTVDDTAPIVLPPGRRLYFSVYNR